MADGDLVSDEWLPRDEPQDAPADAPTPTAGAVAAITIPIGTSMAEAERRLILATLEHHKHQRERTAAVLGISLKTLFNRIKEYGDETPAGEPAAPAQGSRRGP